MQAVHTLGAKGWSLRLDADCAAEPTKLNVQTTRTKVCKVEIEARSVIGERCEAIIGFDVQVCAL
jgi:hypothetical protein